MAKDRKSVFSAGGTRQEIKKQAEEIERKVEGKSEGKRKHLYVDEHHHALAKVQAAKRGMKLSDYIEMLIAQNQ